MGIIKTFVSEEPLDLDELTKEIEETKETTDVDLPSFDQEMVAVDDLIQELEDEELEDGSGETGRDAGGVRNVGGEPAVRSAGASGTGDTRSEDAERDDGSSVSTGVDAAGAEPLAVSVDDVTEPDVVVGGTDNSSVDLGTESNGAPAASVSYQFTPPAIPDDMIKDVTSMRHYAVLVSLRTSRWAAKKKDRKAVRDVKAANAAKGDIGTFDKNLLSGADGPLKRVNSAIDSARTAYYQQTLPWSMTGMTGTGRRQGPRILPNKYFFKFAKQMAGFKKDVQEALDDFVPIYPQLRQKAEENLGTLFNDAEYPDPSAIRSYFSLEFDFSPIPEGGEFKGLDDDVLEKLSNKLNDSVKVMMQNAMDEAWTRLHGVVMKIHERLSDPNKTFHASLITNCKDTCSNLKFLNVAHDQRMDDLRKRVKKKLTKVDAEAIRENPEIRKRIARDAAAILEDMTN